MIIDGGSFLKCNDKRGEGKRNHEFVFDGWGKGFNTLTRTDDCVCDEK